MILGNQKKRTKPNDEREARKKWTEAAESEREQERERRKINGGKVEGIGAEEIPKRKIGAISVGQRLPALDEHREKRRLGLTELGVVESENEIETSFCLVALLLKTK